MTKAEAVKLFVERELQNVPQEWAQCVAEHEDGEPQSFGMWGTVFIVSDFVGDRCADIAEEVYHSAEEAPEEVLQDYIMAHIDGDMTEEDTDALYNSFDAVQERWPELVAQFEEERCDNEMAGAYRVVGPVYLHDVAGTRVLSVNAAGFSFFDEDMGVWPRLYEALGLNWQQCTTCGGSGCLGRGERCLNCNA